MKVPLHHPFIGGIFHEVSHPAIRVSSLLETPTLVAIKMGVPKNGWFIMEIHTEVDYLQISPFLESGNVVKKQQTSLPHEDEHTMPFVG